MAEDKKPTKQPKAGAPAEEGARAPKAAAEAGGRQARDAASAKKGAQRPAQKGAAKPAAKDLGLIAGQRAVITRSRKSIATYKLRDGMPIGCKVTLRGDRMNEYIDRLVTIALPRVQDFRGLNSKSFDGRGNFALGLREHIVFPEIDYDQVAEIWGMDVIVCTTAASDDEARALLRGFNFPFRG